MSEEARRCRNCRYVSVSINKDPCTGCRNHSAWRPGVGTSVVDGEVVEIAQNDDYALAGCEAAQGANQLVTLGEGLEFFILLTGAVGDALTLLQIILGGGFEADRLVLAPDLKSLNEVLGSDVQDLGQFGVCGWASAAQGPLFFGLAGPEAEFLNTSGDANAPGMISKVAADFASNSGDGEGSELDAAVGIETVYSIDEANHPDADQVVEGFARVNVVLGDVADQPLLLVNEILPQPRVTGVP